MRRSKGQGSGMGEELPTQDGEVGRVRQNHETQQSHKELGKCHCLRRNRAVRDWRGSLSCGSQPSKA